MEQIDYDIANARQVSFQTLHTGVLTKCCFQNMAQHIRHVAQVRRVDIDSRKGATSHVELVAQLDIDVGNLVIRRMAARPRRQCFEELLGSNK